MADGDGAGRQDTTFRGRSNGTGSQSENAPNCDSVTSNAITPQDSDSPRISHLQDSDPHPETATDQHQHTPAYCLSPHCHETEGSHVKLGVWISNARVRREKLTAGQLTAIAALGVGWA
ncbi:hypothetical protein GCM10010274_65440 [Streptomyces lavendofoliae]|uniref:Helicase n=1 Tax=Streptomyces lavendofoliae TaxID=67314 RepID=A0A918I5M6_9ACTN|nr:hypothetical protein GCM10010274_65440 [Streptomyces lavendofoliae]